MITNKTLKLSLKSLREFAKKRLPDEVLIDLDARDECPLEIVRHMLDKHITRLVKSDDGDPRFETINDVADVIKLAGRGEAFDLEKEFGISADRIAALDRDTQLAIAAGLDALRDAGIPLVLRYKTTSKGTQLPDRWGLPDVLRDDTGVIFASAFPGLDSFADEMNRYYKDQARREQLSTLESLRTQVVADNGHSKLALEIDGRIADLRATIDKTPYVFERRFLLRTLSMGLYNGLTIEATLDPKAQPFLHDHQIDGTPVLPGVMGIEAFAEAALSVLPGWHVKAIEDVNFLAPFKFYRHERRTVTVEATLRSQDHEMVADCRMVGRRALPNQSEPQITTHFTALVRLSKLAPGSKVSAGPNSQIEPLIEAADVYRLYFHGPAYQVIEKAWWDGKRMIGLLAKNLPDNHRPSNLPTLMTGSRSTSSPPAPNIPNWPQRCKRCLR